jgi:hypothetical protein
MRRRRIYYGLRHFIDSAAAPLRDRPTRQAKRRRDLQIFAQAAKLRDTR